MTDKIDITLRINGRDHAIRVEPRRTLVDAIREALKPGAKLTDEELIAKAEALRETLKDAIDARVGDWIREAKAPADATFNQPGG